MIEKSLKFDQPLRGKHYTVEGRQLKKAPSSNQVHQRICKSNANVL